MVNILHKKLFSLLLAVFIVSSFFVVKINETTAATSTTPECNGSSFDSANLGSVNGQDGWTSTGSYDQEVIDNIYGYTDFGCKTWRLSNAVTSGSFGDQSFAAPLTDSVGETDATAGSFSVGTKQNHFEAQFDIASANPSGEQSGLAISVSPDRGDGSRMSYLRFEDQADGIHVYFDDVTSVTSPADWTETDIQTITRTPHTIKLTMDTFDGPSNDVVKVYIDGILVHTGTSWENYFRYDTEASAESSPRIVKTLIFRAAGTSAPSNSGAGFLFDNISLTSSDEVAPSTAIVAVNADWSRHAFGTDENLGSGYIYGINAFSDVLTAIKAVDTQGTVKIAPGDYDLNKDDTTLISGQSGWYLPINKEGLTLMGVDASGQEITDASSTAANLYSTQETANGAWSSQNLITVFSDNVTIKGLNIMNKISPNKAIEVLGDNFKAENCTFSPIPLSLFADAADYHDITDNSDHNDISKYGSGVYFNNNSATTARTGTVINNIFKNSGITFDSFGSNWTVDIKNNIFDGNKIWSWTDGSGFHSQYYSSVGATTWANQPDFTGSVININDNDFINMDADQVIVKIKDTMTGAFNAKNNWWDTDVKSDIQTKILGNVSFLPYYTDAAKTELSESDIVVTAENFNTNKSTDYYGIATGYALSGADVASVASVKVELYDSANNLLVTNTSKSANKVNTAKQYSSAFRLKIGTYTDSSTWDLGDVSWSPTLAVKPAKVLIKVTDVNGLVYTAENSSLQASAPSHPTWEELFPSVTKIGDNSADVVISAGSVDLVFSEELATDSKTAVEKALSDGADKSLTYAWSGSTLTISAAEDTTFANDVLAKVLYPAGRASATLLLIDSKLEPAQTTPETSEDGSGVAVIDPVKPEVVITNPVQPVKITISSGTPNPKIDVSSFIDGSGSGVLPEINITSVDAGNANVVIPSSTTVTSADPSWDGVIAAPTITTVTLPETLGQVKTLTAAIEVGFTGAKLSFDKAVRILLIGQAGKRAGYTRTGIAFTEITNVCAGDSQAVGDALVADGECKIDVGGDLVIWTKHFTSFAAYSQTANIGGGGGGGGVTTGSCTSVEYTDWGSCIDGFQYRNLKSQLPSGCQATAIQIADGKKACEVTTPADTSEVVTEATPIKIEESKPVNTDKPSTISEQVLGVKSYADGVLLRANKKIFVVAGDRLIRIHSLKDLDKYKGREILNVTQSVIDSYFYADGTLLRSKNSKKIYVIVKGSKVYVKNLVELRKYIGKPIIDVSDDVLKNY